MGEKCGRGTYPAAEELGARRLTFSLREKVLGNDGAACSRSWKPLPTWGFPSETGVRGTRRKPGSEAAVRGGRAVPGGGVLHEARWVPLTNPLTLQKCRGDEASREQAAATRPDEPAQMAGR